MPVFDPKGIECVRRDTCPAVMKILEKALRIVFDTRDLSEVRAYLERQWTKIVSHRVAIPDFVFAKEVKQGNYSEKASPAHAIVAAKLTANDRRAEPAYRERVKYVVVHGDIRSRLMDSVLPPEGLLESKG